MRKQELYSMIRDYNKINDLFYSGKDTKAIEHIKKITQRSESNETIIVFWNGYFFWRIIKNYKNALSFLNLALSCNPDNQLYCIANGKCYLDLNNYDKAEQLFRLAKEIDVLWSEPWSCLGDLYRRKKMYKEAERAYKNAIKLNNEDPYPLNGLGNTYCKIKEFNAAYNAYTEAISKKKNHLYTLNGLGDYFYFKKEYKTAIDKYKDVLKKNKNNSYSWSGIGNAYFNLQSYDYAIDAYEKAHNVDLNNPYPLEAMGKAFKRKKDYLNAVKFFACAWTKSTENASLLLSISKCYNLLDRCDIKTAIRIVSKEMGHVLKDERSLRYAYLAAKLKIDTEIWSRKGDPFAFSQIGSVGKLAASIETSCERQKQCVTDILADMEKVNAVIDHFITAPSNFDKSKSFFMGLRKWNSYTPSLPHDDDRSLGGGYFLYNNGLGTVIDPGFNFIENFYRAGGQLDDINNIIITHAHNDHTNDLESLLTFFYRRYRRFLNDKSGKIKKHKGVSLFINLGAMKKFSGLLNLRNIPYINTIRVINNLSAVHMLDEGIHITVLPAYHDEILSRRYCVGLCIDINIESKIRRILYTSDTGLFPPCKEHSAQGSEIDITKPQIWEEYEQRLSSKQRKIDILIPHLGSLRKEELTLKVPVELLEEGCSRLFSRSFYPNHLGLMGCVQLIHKLNPKLTLLSEFGEELKPRIKDVVELLKYCVRELTTSTGYPKMSIVLPCEMNLFIDLCSMSIFSIVTRKFIPAHQTKIYYTGSSFIFHTDQDKAKGLLSEAEKILKYTKDFESMLRGKSGIFFASNLFDKN